jgi:hypothetical protein
MLFHALLTVPQDRTRVDRLLRAYDGNEAWSSESRGLLAELSDSFANILSPAFVAAVGRHIGLPFLKKSSEVRFVLACEKVLELVRSGVLRELDETVAREIAEAVSVAMRSGSERRL